MAHTGEPFVEIHPADATELGTIAATLVTLNSALGKVIVRAKITTNQQQGTVFAPMHWSRMNASLAFINGLMLQNTDHISGQPELKFSPANIKPFDVEWYGFTITQRKPDMPDIEYWANARADKGFRFELACRTTPKN
jgi:assimilatory nitrate reductase catalytic subunit